MTKEQILTNYNAVPYCGCHIWDGGLHTDGYGQVWFQGKNNHVHRLMYEFEKGPIPEGMCVCHTCDTPSCMNIGHLFIGTQADNIQDCINKGRAKRPRGSRNGNTKLTESQVIEIRTMLKKGEAQNEIAQKFGVARSTTGYINTGYRWGWLR